MQFTPEKVKGKIRSLAKQKNADARTLMRIYMMERFLERISVSKYKDNFVIKGGMLITAMVGVSLRSTMDIDTSIKNHTLSEEEARRMIDEISRIDVKDGVSFEIKEAASIMDEMEYTGIRFSMDAVMGNLCTPLKIDISTGDIITPHAMEYQYKLLLENRSIDLWSYNLETILAEKMQTVLARGLLNTRMRDFYDIRILLSLYDKEINAKTLRKAFCATCKKRGTETLIRTGETVLDTIKKDTHLQELWGLYKKKYSYASEISYESIIKSMESLFATILENR